MNCAVQFVLLAVLFVKILPQNQMCSTEESFGNASVRYLLKTDTRMFVLNVHARVRIRPRLNPFQS
jgi:hypothetical protein